VPTSRSRAFVKRWGIIVLVIGALGAVSVAFRGKAPRKQPKPPRVEQTDPRGSDRSQRSDGPDSADAAESGGGPTIVAPPRD